jgi:DDE_Tnp_1-associated
METSQLGLLSAHVARGPDPRVDRTTRHLWLDSGVIAVCAVMCGAETWVEIAGYGRAKYEWVKRFLPLPHGIPSHATLARVLARVAPEAVRPCFLAWLSQVQARIGGPLAGHLVASEGKAARPSLNRAIDRGPLHRVSAWATASHLVVGQRAVEQKRHESTAIPTLLPRLELSGGIGTIEALGPHKEMAQTLLEQEADDVLALKGPQGTVPEDVALLFEGADTPQSRALVHQP